jgi:DNA replication and repair protein RecF
LKLNSLRLSGFRNLETAELNFDPILNIFIGANGQGKTNLLEAVNMTATLKTFKTGIKNADLIRWGDSEAHLTAQYDESGPLPVDIHISPEGKKATLSGTKIKDAAELGKNLAAVTFTPDDLQLVKGSPDNRRRALDRFCFGLDPRYAQCYRRYAKALAHRNQLLKSYPVDRLSLDAFNETLILTGLELIQLRFGASQKWACVFEEQLESLVGGAFGAQMQYQSQVFGLDNLRAFTTEELQQLFREKMASKADEEVRRRTSLVGPHLDDIYFDFSGRAARKIVSQGQARAMVLALKIAEVQVIHQARHHPPLLLLDDVISELDTEKASNLLQKMVSLGTQTFMTTTELTPLFKEQNGMAFNLTEGRVNHTKKIQTYFVET